jgi:hypothetical protein
MNQSTPGITSSSAVRALHAIKVRVHRLEELFNSLDPTPFPHRDLDDAAEEFIVSWARELPRSVPLTLRIDVIGPAAGEEHARRTRDAIHAYFAYRSDITRLRFKQLMSRGRASLLVGTIFLVACIVGANLLGQHDGGTATDVLRESLIIAGWVAMWRPLEIVLYDWWPVLGERRLYERLSRAEVEITSLEKPGEVRGT